MGGYPVENDKKAANLVCDLRSEADKIDRHAV
jgi:hypothetical protein